MSEPEKCPKCNATEGIVNTADFSSLFGIANEYEKEWFCTRCKYNFNDDEAEFWYENCDLSKMKLSQIADVIMSDWSDDITPYARPYVEAMMGLSNISDNYGSSDAEGIVSYFLSNAKQWKGPTARKVKAHLKKLVSDYQKSQK